jgi:hypothetical protein
VTSIGRGGDWGTPKAFTLTPGPREASTDSFRNHRPLEFGKHAHHLKHRLAGGRRGVEALLAQEQVDVECVQLGQKTDQVLQAATQSVHRPRHDHFEFPSRGITAQLVERWPLVAAFGAADAVIVKFENLTADASRSRA